MVLEQVALVEATATFGEAFFRGGMCWIEESVQVVRRL